ncbi:hypothetical protein [Rariglobus hedericola]|uniref:Uncharacterized protein n=1 Tax=Rariglobus hedericola TaxID=2597822 RepID=A0A556QRH9_9BACT|nr:hypothetical protein [Rariglobus hedericola]TSJ79241.1 hypothetical protein FPL22_08100 [Rariglobus hedericola]
MTKSIPVLFALVTLLGLSGCVTQPTATTPTAATSTLGDRATYKLEEIVVSLPLAGSQGPYQNLHITLAVFINPLRESYSYDYEAQGLVRRLEPRINSTVSASLLELDTQTIANTKALRIKAIAEAEKVLANTLRNWTYAADYKIEINVLNIYWTDSSGGREPSPASRW